MASNILNLPTEETLQSIATALTTMQGNVSGVKGNEETTYRTGQVNLTAANIGALPANTTYVTSVNGQSGVITGLATTSDLNTVRLIAEGAGAAVSFATYTSMISNLNNAAATDYKVGQSIYIATLDVPDLWVFEVSENQILYYYTDDAAFKTLLASQGYVQVGYCKLAALETQKVDLSNHMTLNTDQTVTGLKSFDEIKATKITSNSSTKNISLGTNDFNISFDNVVTTAKFKTGANDSYGIGFPSTTSLAANKTVALAEDVVDLTSAQTISGAKTFSSVIMQEGGIQFDTNKHIDIKNSSGSLYYRIGETEILPFGTPTIGSSSRLLNNIYLSGAIKDNNNNSVSVADISNGIFNVINASDIAVSNILTQAQIDVITNGKPTIIKGTLLDYDNPILFSVRTASNYGNRSYVGAWLGSKQAGFATYAVFTIMNTGQIKIEKALIYYNLQASNEMQAYFGDVTASRNLYFNKGLSTGTTLQLGWNNSNIAIEATAATFKVACNNFISRNGTNLSDIGSSTVSWKDLYLAGKINPNASSYGLTLPDTTNFAANKEIATVEDTIENITGYPAYDNTATYVVGAKVLYNNVGYRCKTAVSTAETFDSTKWEVIQLKDYVDINTDQVVKGTKTFKTIQFVKDTSNPTSGTKLEVKNDNGYNAKILFGNYGFMFTSNSVQPSGTVTFGTSSAPWSKIYTNQLSKNNSTYGITLPDMSAWTADKEIATTDYFGFPKISAPSSTILTDDLITTIKIGCTVNGTFLGLKYPVFLPTNKDQEDANTIAGFVIGDNSAYATRPNLSLYTYEINKTTKNITKITLLYEAGAFTGEVSAKIAKINNKSINYYLNNVYHYATLSGTQLKYETINNISISTDTTYTLATAPTGTYPEYRANITNTDTSNAITITLPSGTIVKAESGITVSSNTFTIPADTTVVVSIQDDLALVMIKG